MSRSPYSQNNTTSSVQLQALESTIATLQSSVSALQTGLSVDFKEFILTPGTSTVGESNLSLSPRASHQLAHTFGTVPKLIQIFLRVNNLSAFDSDDSGTPTSYNVAQSQWPPGGTAVFGYPYQVGDHIGPLETEGPVAYSVAYADRGFLISSNSTHVTVTVRNAGFNVPTQGVQTASVQRDDNRIWISGDATGKFSLIIRAFK